jgi:multiple sugar transport system substrate-binding protein
MDRLSRRSLLRASLGLAAAGTLVRPFIANAAATTASVWWVQGFIPEEDVAFRKLVADYEKASGNTIDYSIVPFAPLRQKIVSAITSGVVPDVINATPPEIVPESAWKGQLVDVTDVVETQKSHYFPTALASAYCYSNVEKRRSYYGAPFASGAWPFHIWGSLIEKAGYKVSDLPKTWDAFCDFFKPVQRSLQAQGMRHTYGMGWVVSTVGNDPTSTFQAHMIAYGGKDLVTPDGRLHADDPKVREAVIRALIRLTTDYKEGYVPPGSVNWNDADDNNAFHSQLCVMDFDGSISTEVALYHNKQAYYHDTITHPLPLSNEGKVLPSEVLAGIAFIPKGAKNIPVAKDFLKYLIQPKVSSDYLKGGLGRNVPAFQEVAKDDPFWLDPKDPHRPPYVRQVLFGPTIPAYFVYNPAYAEVRTAHPFNVAFADIVSGGMKTEEAADKALRRIEAIFAKYPIQQS